MLSRETDAIAQGPCFALCNIYSTRERTRNPFPLLPFLRVKNERRVPYTFERRFVVGVEDGTSWVGGEERLDVRNVKCQVFEYFEWERIIFSPRSIIGDVLFRNF